MVRSTRRLLLAAVIMVTIPLVSGLVAGCNGDQGGDTTTVPSAKTEGAQTGSLYGVGDGYFPQAGNTGYDVKHYVITLDYDPNEDRLAGTTVVEARALMDLTEFHLDLVGLDIGEVSLDGVSAAFRREGQELIVECPKPVRSGEDFSVLVGYSGTPQSMTSADGYTIGWQRSGDTAFTLDEPEGAATWYPLNDHPIDKATYSFRLTVPKPYAAVANGVLVAEQDLGDDRTFSWEMEQPMANYLASVVVDELVLEQKTSPAGVAIRDYFGLKVAQTASSAFSRTGEVLDYFSELFGPYPFDVYGVVVPDIVTQGMAMENQTMSLFGSDTVRAQMAGKVLREMYLSHELAHQWFGNSVTITEWKDVWLNEGFATYASWLWAEHDGGERALQAFVDRAFSSLSSENTVLGDPGADGLFSRTVYQRGALTLHALRSALGDDRFFAVLRAWVSEHAYGNVATEDLVDLVEREASGLAGFDAQAFFDAWLYQAAMPEWPTAER